MKEYLRVLKDVYENGYDHESRNGGRRSIFGAMQRYDLREGFPLVTTRKIYTRAIIEELLFFIRGDTDVSKLQDVDVHIWDKWAVGASDIEALADKLTKEIPNGEDKDQYYKALVDGMTANYLNKIGPMYGHVWRNASQARVDRRWPDIEFKDLPSDKLQGYIDQYKHFVQSEEYDSSVTLEKFSSVLYQYTVDQLNNLVIGLKKNPYSSRHVVTAWSPMDVPFDGISPQENVLLGRGALAACHAMFQCFVRPGAEPNDKLRLSLKVSIRSNDFPIGAPYNIAQYALLTELLAHVTDMEAYELIVDTGDTHIYLDQLDGVEEQLKREPKQLPKLKLNPNVKDLFKFTSNDIEIVGYEPHGAIDYPVSV